MKNILSFLSILVLSINLSAQQFELKGRIIDKVSSEGIVGANVGLYRMPDSTLITGIQTDANGNFIIPNVPGGMYRAQVTFVGYSTMRFPVRMNENKDIGTKSMESTMKNLKGIEVEGAQQRAVQKGDTTEINADAFKVNPDATAEDLVKKMPGITVDNGVVKAGGEEVKKVLIDGKEFFGDDASMALKNLPAEVVNKIQFFDKMSDQAQFSGFDDGNSKRTMNVVTRKGMKNAQFGKIYAGGGTDDRYNAGLNMNFFKGNRRFTVLGQSNNINQQNFSSQDLLGVMGSGGGGGGMGGGGMGRMMGMAPGANDPSNFMVGQSNGINTTHSLGLNYSDSLSPKVKLSGSYFFNNSANATSKNIDRDYYLNDSTNQRYSESNTGWSNNLNHRLNLRVEINLDTNNSIIYTPRLSWQANQNGSDVMGNTIRNAIDSISSTATNNVSRNTGYSMSHNVLLRHKFKKFGRTISLTLNSDNSEKNGLSGLGSSNSFLGLIDTTITLKQQSGTYSNAQNYSSNIMFTEPLGKVAQLFLNYSPTLAFNNSSKETNRLNPLSQEFTSFDTLLSNRYNNTITTQKGGAGIRIRTAKLMMVFNANAQQVVLDGTQTFPQAFAIKRTFNNIVPFAMMNYKFSSSTNLRVFYRSNTNVPSISQLQSVVDNSNPLQLSTGNTNLKQEYSQSISTRFASANLKSSRAFFANISSTFTNNYIANSTFLANSDTLLDGIQIRKGSQLTRPVNLNGYMSVNSLLTYSLPVKWIKSTLNLQGGVNYTLKPGEINGLKNETSTITYNGGLVIASNISEKIDFTLTYNGGWNQVQSTLQPTLNNNYVVQTAGFKWNWLPWKGLVLNTEINHSRYDGLGTGFNQNFTLWNAGIGYKFLKGKSGELRATAFDILNQNTSISRSITETYVEDNRTKVLNRYFMLTFTFTFRKFNGMKMPEVPTDPHGGPGGPGGHPMGPPPVGR
ncbi:MAG TPA: outer membrane beta-barrel protein [Flavobacteriales bacterium]|nr:outer membrane beta-barrel protein [Flavobacteriales bacterium]HPH83343.1 outer membrane beta-barrel protein [Flavobacteriales bacterium]